MKNSDEVRLLVTSGNGPEECRLAASKTLVQLRCEANVANLQCSVILAGSASQDDVQSALVCLKGKGAKLFSKRWCGTIQWIARSPFRPNHKRRNWFVGIFELNAEESSVIDLRKQDICFETFRAGGPGGQHQNTTDSAVRAIHLETGLSAISKDERSQHRNKKIAIKRLAERLLLSQLERDANSRSAENELHKQLERGNPIRRFQGGKFVAK